MKKFFTLLILILCAALSVPLNAATSTVTASKITSSSVTWTGSAKETWNVAVSGGATNQNMNSDYAQVGTRANPSTSITFSTSGISGTISSIVINCASYNGLGAVSATVGGNAFGTQSQSIPTWSNSSGGNVTFSGNASGAISITMTNASNGRAMYIKSITVTYTTGSNQVATPEFSPAAGTYNSAQSVSISCTTAGATIYYTTDGSTPTTSSSVYSSAITVSSTTTIKAIAVKSGMTNSEEAVATYTIEAPGSGTTFERITSTSDLEIGKRYIIVYNSGAKVMGAIASFNGTMAGSVVETGYTVSGNEITLPSTTNVKYVTLGGNSSDGWTLQLQGDNYLYWSSGNSLNTNASVSDNSRWTIGFSGDNVLINNKADATRKLQYNTGSPRFACYTSAQGAIMLYKEVEEETQCATPTFSVAEGTYGTAQSVEISCATAGATIYYTTDGTTPSSSNGTLYTSAITVSSTTTIRAIAVKSGLDDSEVATATYTIQQPCATPTFSVAAGTYTSIQNVTISTTTPSATIYYTTNGDTPTTSSSVYSGAIEVSESMTIKAIAVATGYANSAVAEAAYTINLPQAATPTFAPAAGTYTSTQNVTISTTTPSATIYYTTDGTTPSSSNGTEYTSAITVSSTTTIKAIAVKSGMTDSQVAEATYTIEAPGSGTTFERITSTSDLEVGKRYIIVNSNNNAALSGTRAQESITVSNYTTTLESGTTVNIYTLGGAEDEWTFKIGSTYLANTGTTNGTSLDGKATLSSDVLDEGKWKISFGSSDNAIMQCVHIFGSESGRYLRSYSSQDFRCYASQSNGSQIFLYKEAAPETQCATPTFSPAEGTINNATNVTISCTTAGATIYYTTDGSTPTTSSTEYDGTPISVSATTTIKAIAVKSGLDNSEVAIAEYEFVVGQPTFSPNGGTHDQSVTVTISTASTGATIYYTTDGSEPTTSSSVYSEPLPFTRTTTLKAIAVLNGVSSEMRVATFTVNKASGVTTLWSEPWTGYAKDAVPTTVSTGGTGTATYAIVDGGTASKIYAESLAGGTSPELLIAKGGGSMTATITLPAGTSGDLTLRFLENGDRISVTSSTTDVTVGPLSYNSSSKQAEVTISLASATTELVLVFSNSYSSNTRVDNFMLTKVTPAVPDPVISPEGGTYDNVQTVTITCDDEDAHIYYTISYDGTEPADPTDGSTEYTGAITVSNSPTTIKAIAYDEDRIYFSEMVTANYTLKAGTPNPTAVETQEINASLSYKAQSTTEGATIWYTLDGTDPVVNGSNSSSVANGGFITIDHTCTLKMMAVKTGFVNSEIKTIAWTYIPVLSPQFTLAPGTYTDAQGTYIMEDTDDATVYYTISYDGTEPADPTNASTLYAVNTRIELPIGTTIIKAIAYNGLGEYSNVTRAQYICNQGNYELRITPSSGSYVSAVDVSILEEHKVGSSLIYYTTDGTDPSSSGTAVEYDGTPITISRSCTLRVYGIDEHAVAAEGTYTSSATYRIGVQAPVFSPLSGSTLEYKGDQDIQIFSTTLNAKIYYIISNSAAPADPTKTTGTLYTGDNSDLKDLSVGTYYIKAIAYVGDEASAVSSGEFHVSTESTGLLNVAALNNYGHAESSSYIPFQNPIQIVFMDRYLNGYDSNPANDTLQYAYVRDNSGYGIIYFGNPRKGYGAGKTHFDMGDWIDGTQVSGHISNWSLGLPGRYQMGESNGGINSWPTSTIGHTDILPEEVTIAEINSGDEGTDNLWAHYVHVKNTDVRVLRKNSERWQGIVKEELTGDSCVYYDSFYLHNDKDASYWNSQPVHRTFDIAGVVVYYSGLSGYASNFELAPIAFEYTDMPQITPAGGHKAGPLNVTIDFYSDVPNADKDGVSFYYKTSTMDDYALYTGPFTVRSTTTVEAYSVRISEITGEELRSLVVSEEYIFDQVERPVISPESKVFTKNEPVSVTITCETPSAIIWYTTDGTDPLSASGTRQRYIPGETVITITESTTVRAIATKGTVSSTEAESRTYTLVKDNGIKYVLVKNVNELADGSTYVIVNQLYSVAMSNNQKTANRDAVAVTLSGASNDTVHVNEDVARFTLTASGGGWNLYTEDGESTAHGYLSAGVASQNQLLTSATASDETLATIAIDPTDYHATVTFTDKGGSTRYLRYFRNSNLYNLYTSETSNTRPVFIYKREVTDLADIVKNGKIGNQYTVADDIVGVFVPANDPDALYAKDLNKSRFRQYNDKGAKDYLHDVMGIETAALDYDQSTWVRITGLPDPGDFEGKIIPGGTLAGHLRNKINPEFEYDSGTTLPTAGDASSYTHQTYTPANFMGEYLTGNHNIEYFFVVPKPQEYVKVVGAVYAGENQFFVPEPDDATNENLAGLEGGFSVDWSILNAGGSVPTGISTGESYEMEGIAYALSSGGSGSGVRRRTSSASNSLKLKPTSIEITNPVTGVDGVDVARKVVGVRYYNMNGMQNDRPFENSINVMVITYDDGSTVSRKIAF